MAKHQDWKKVLKADPTAWLLEPDDPGVRYLALRDIVEAGEKEIKTARQKAYSDGPIGIILKNMNPEGWWVTPGLGYTPKFRSTVWQIISLAQLGASVEDDKRIATACSYFLDNGLAKGGQISPIGMPISTGQCLQGNMLTALVSLGVTDNRLQTAYEWMARTVTREDLPKKLNNDGFGPSEVVKGPFRYLTKFTEPVFGCRTNQGLSCAWAGLSVLMAFSRLPKVKRTDLIEKAVNMGIEFFFSVDPATADFPGNIGGTPNPWWWQFKFPDFYIADILKLAEVFTAFGYGSDPKLTNTFKMIQDKQDENSRWVMDYIDKSHKMWVKYGVEGEPNKWITLRALRVLKQAEQQMVK